MKKRRTRHSRSWFGKLYQVLSPTTPELNAQLIRLLVLFEDLKIETAAAVPSRTFMDFAGKNHRRFYFIRGALQTCREIHSAFDALNRDDDFIRLIRDPAILEHQQEWKRAVRYFADNAAQINDIRNVVGGHFSRTAGVHVAKTVNSDSPIQVEIKAHPTGHGYGITFHNAYDFVAVAMGEPKNAQDYHDYIQGVYRTMLGAFEHFTNVMNGLISQWLLKQLGHRRRS